MELIVAVALAAAVAWQIAGSFARGAREDAARRRQVALLQLFAAGQSAVQADPKALLVWQPLAKAARDLLPKDFASLDVASGRTFPFTKDQLQSAHDLWTADWLAWERTHDAEYKLKAAVAEQELTEGGGSALARSRLEAVEREKLEMYQRRYQEYVQIAKALQALTN